MYMYFSAVSAPRNHDTTNNGAHIRWRAISHLGTLHPLVIIDSLPRLPPSRSHPPQHGDNAAKIISVTRRATCRGNFAAISNFLGSLVRPPPPLLLPFPSPLSHFFPEGKGRRKCESDARWESEAKRKEATEQGGGAKGKGTR